MEQTDLYCIHSLAIRLVTKTEGTGKHLPSPMYPSTQRRRSHTFTEGTFEEVAKRHHGNDNFLSPKHVTTADVVAAKSNNDLVRQRSAGSPDLRKTDDRSPILQKLHRKFFSQDVSGESVDFGCLRGRASTNSMERVLQRGDNLEFEIPNLTPPRSPLTSPKLQNCGNNVVTNQPFDLGELNLALYKQTSLSSSDGSMDDHEIFSCQTNRPQHEKLKLKSSLADDDQLKTTANLDSSFERIKYLKDDEERVKMNSVGTITLSFRYTPHHHLLIKLIDIQLNYQPTCVVKEAQWTIQPYLVINIVSEARSPPDKRHFHLFHHKPHIHILTRDSTCELNVKNKISDGQFLNIVLYDGELMNKDLAIGAIQFNLSELVVSSREKIVTNDLSMYHELYDRVEGALSCSMQWQSTSMLLKFHIDKISYQKHFHHQMKELFIKMSMYIGQEECFERQTKLYQASDEISIDQTFNIELTPDKIRNMHILVQVFEKHLMGNISLHRSVIGPYMKPTLKEGTLSCWEKTIMCPGEEVSCICNLYN